MSYGRRASLPEFDHEMAEHAARCSSAFRQDKVATGRAHPKSNTLGWNANHLAEIPGWVEGTLTHWSGTLLRSRASPTSRQS